MPAPYSQHPREDSGEVLTVRPIGAKGTDLFTDPSAVDMLTLTRSEDAWLTRGVAQRRKGALKLTQFVTSAASHTFGTDAK